MLIVISKTNVNLISSAVVVTTVAMDVISVVDMGRSFDVFCG
jgi:hypothetical protein